MKTTKQISKCCKAHVEVVGMPDFIGSNDICTMHNECMKCKQPCDLVDKEVDKEIQKGDKDTIKCDCEGYPHHESYCAIEMGKRREEISKAREEALDEAIKIAKKLEKGASDKQNEEFDDGYEFACEAMEAELIKLKNNPTSK